MKPTSIWTDGVSIIVPTFKRPDDIRRALESLYTQSAGDRPIEIIVADNDPAGSAAEAVKSMVKSSPYETHYIHVPKPGVSNARNGALKKARGRFIAFLDDDMEAGDLWLEGLLATSEAFDAGLCFGPIEAVMPQPENNLTHYMRPYFERALDKPEGLISHPFGTGGCLLDLKKCNMPEPAFNPALNEVGGEDDFLFAHLLASGTQIGWSPKALTHEHVPTSRVTLDHMWKRNFRFGQGPSQSCADKGLRGTFGILLWMSVGLIQTIANGTAALTSKILGRSNWVAYAARTAQGLGKMLWWDQFSPRIYGTGASGSQTGSASSVISTAE